MPAAAGLKTLRPVPPNGIFTTTMANAAATAGSQYGDSGDIIMPMSAPVTAAVPSVTDGLRRSSRQMMVSHSMAVAMPTSTSSTGRKP